MIKINKSKKNTLGVNCFELLLNNFGALSNTNKNEYLCCLCVCVLAIYGADCSF